MSSATMTTMLGRAWAATDSCAAKTNASNRGAMRLMSSSTLRVAGGDQENLSDSAYHVQMLAVMGEGILQQHLQLQRLASREQRAAQPMPLERADEARRQRHLGAQSALAFAHQPHLDVPG